MKIKYKDIVGNLIPEEYSDSCMCCYFRYHGYCIPYNVWQCVDTIFAKSESQVFEL